MKISISQTDGVYFLMYSIYEGASPAAEYGPRSKQMPAGNKNKFIKKQVCDAKILRAACPAPVKCAITPDGSETNGNMFTDIQT